jgi:hypothetical protein
MRYNTSLAPHRPFITCGRPGFQQGADFIGLVRLDFSFSIEFAGCDYTIVVLYLVSLL